MNKEIPLLTERDVELRVGIVTKDNKHVTLLVYKDARVDMRVLDDVYGPLNWTREHSTIDGQLFCTVSIWDDEKKQWISKQDVGTESKTEAEKGRASDSFKRACFNIGIGRELYDAPFIYIDLTPNDFNQQNKLKTRFRVAKMKYDKANGEFTEFRVVDNYGKIRFDKVSVKTTRKEDTSAPNTDIPDSVKLAQEVFGGKVNVVVDNEFVKVENGIYYLYSQRQKNWFTFEQLSTKGPEVLNSLMNNKDYELAHNAIYQYLSSRKW